MITKAMAKCRVVPRFRRTRGFSLIEVLIALLLLSFGLLGLGFLQVMNVRYTQSAQHRTMATNLAYEVLDMMRSNHVAARQFGSINPGSFSGVKVPASGCARSASGAYVDNIARWKCEVVSSLPAGNAEIGFDGDNVTVTVSWSDDVGRDDNPGVGKPGKTTRFEVTARL
ncbi:MAG: type IV pilus modification protein PilV [Stenotrophomonas sp.]